jgi:hypothetical protein
MLGSDPPSAVEVENVHVAVGARHGVEPATNPLSYRQLKPNHGPRFQG